MIYLTLIARVSDGLPLTASIQEEENLGKSIVEYQSQAKRLFRTLSSKSPPRCSIETGQYLFHYIIEQGVCLLILCDAQFNKRLAFAFLDDLAAEFHSQYSRKINSVNRPYSFIEFDTYIQKAKRSYTDGSSDRGGARNSSAAAPSSNNHTAALNNELHDVQRLMVQNIDDVLQRGAILSELDGKAQNLTMLSAKYKKDASSLNASSWVAGASGLAVLLFVFLIYTYLL